MKPTAPDLPTQLVQLLERTDGDLTKRPVHTWGITAVGKFTPSAVAADYCRAAHFADPGTPVDVTVRFSNGSGSKFQHDGWSDVRGMATRFHITPEIATDLIAMTLAEFFSDTPEEFARFAEAAAPVDYHGEPLWAKIVDLFHLVPPARDPYPEETISPDPGAIAYAAANPVAHPGVFDAAGIGAPVSYARAAYHAVHTFVVTNARNTQRWVRFSWQPILGVLTTDPKTVPVDNYLADELRERLKTLGNPRFSLMMTIGETGDAFDNPARPWPPHRVRIQMGVMELTGVPEDQETFCEKLSFNPGLLTDGIEMSNDPVLSMRKEVYIKSSEMRHATPCPFSGGRTA